VTSAYDLANLGVAFANNNTGGRHRVRGSNCGTDERGYSDSNGEETHCKELACLLWVGISLVTVLFVFMS
jgi:hypothetical protein